MANRKLILCGAYFIWLVDVAPRDAGEGIPLYQRNAQRDGTVAPMKTVTRFVTSSLLGQK